MSDALMADALSLGQELPGIEVDPISRLDLALYCGASGDHNPIHVDIDFARAAGRDDVFVHGMLVMAHLGRAVTGWVPRSAVREFDVRFLRVTEVGDRLRCTGKVTRMFEANGERLVAVELSVHDQANELKARGAAVLAVR